MVGGSPGLDEVWLVTLEPTFGAVIKKTRSCLVVSPDESNRHLRTVIIAPMTTVAMAVSHARGAHLSGQARAGGA